MAQIKNNNFSTDRLFTFLLQNTLVKYTCIALVSGLAIFWIYCTNKYSVNILFWDQWDFYNPFTKDIEIINTFTKQHGPHRQGIGFILTKCIDYFSSMDIRYISFTITLLIFLTSISYFYLKKRLIGRSTIFDSIIFLIILAPTQLFMHTANISHGAMPSLLLSLYTLSFLLKNYTLRSVLLVVINFNMIFSGFGIFIGVLTPIIFLGEWYFFYRKKSIKSQLISATALLFSLLSFYLFSIGYKFQPAAPNFVFPHPNPFEYFQFMAIGYASFLGMVDIGIKSYGLGFITLILLLIVLYKHTINIFKNKFDVENKQVTISKIIVLLIAYSLIFLFNTAVGRVGIGLEAAKSPRYMPYLAPSLFALYLHLSNLDTKKSRILVLLFFFGLLISLSFGNKNISTMNHFASAKSAWKKSYLKYENIERANIQSSFLIHPNSESTKLKEKLNFLKENKLNLFKNQCEGLTPLQLPTFYKLDTESLDKNIITNDISNISIIDNRTVIEVGFTDPYFIISDFEGEAYSQTQLYIEIVAPFEILTQLFYTTKEKTGFSEEASIIKNLAQGENKLYIDLDPKLNITSVRIDLGNQSGTFEIKEMTLKGIPASIL